MSLTLVDARLKSMSLVEATLPKPQDSSIVSHEKMATDLVRKPITPEETDAKLSEIIGFVDRLAEEEPSEGRATCKSIHDAFDLLIIRTQENVDVLSRKEEEVCKKLLKTNDDSITLSNQIQSCRIKINEIDAEIAKVHSHQEGLKHECERLKAEKKRLKKQISKEKKKRKNGVLDLIPGHGLIDGLIKGDPKRAIPGYSSVKAIVSSIRKDKERCESYYSAKKKELESVCSRLYAISQQKIQEEAKKSAFDTELSRLQSTEKVLDQEIKACGKELTHVRNVLSRLKGMVESYRFLKLDMDNLDEFKSSGLLNETSIPGFKNEVLQLKILVLDIIPRVY